MADNPYVGPRSIKTGEAFFGRDREVRSLSALLLAERIVLLHSPSGAGKSSLIEAGLRPRMEERFHVSPLVRVNLEIPDELRDMAGLNRYLVSTLLSLEEGWPLEQRLPLTELATLSLDAYLDKRILPDDTLENSLLLFDQFEEVLTVSPTDAPAKQHFFEQLGEALQNRRRWALFTIREDYMGGLAPYVRAIPNRLSVTFRLGLLGTQAAKLAIQQPAKEKDVDFTEAAAQKLVDDLCLTQVQQPDGSFKGQPGPDVEPVQLQVVCYNLWQSPRADQKSINENDVQSVGSVDQALASFYAERLQDICQKSQVDERIVRQWFNERLITTDGIRSQVLKGAQSSAELPNTILSQLESAYLIRGETRAGKTWYELSHDRLVQPVRLDNTAWFEQNLSVFQRRAVLWNQQGRSEGLLLRGKEFMDAEKETATLQLSPDESAFLEACLKLRKREQRDRQQRRLIIAGFVLTLVLLSIAIFFGINANAATQDAKNQAAKAVLSAKDAATSQARAEAAQLTAVANENEAKKQAQIVIANQLAFQVQRNTLTNSSYQMLSALLSIQSLKVFPNADSANFLINNNLAARPISHMTHDGAVFSVAFSPDGKYVVSGGYKTARVWEATSGREVARMAYEGAVLAVAFSPNGKYVVSGGCDKEDSDEICHQGSARVWETASSREAARMVYEGAVLAVAFSPDGKYVVSGGCDKEDLSDTCTQGSARVWETTSGREVARITYADAVRSVAFSPDGKYVVSGGCDKEVSDEICHSGYVVWEATSGREVARMSYYPIWVSSLAFSPDGKFVVSGGCDEAVLYSCGQSSARVWEIASGKEVAHMTYGGEVRSVAFSPDGKYVVSGGCDEIIVNNLCKDGSARVWEATTGKEVARMTHDNWVESVAFSPDGKYVVSGGCDKRDSKYNCTQGSARVWIAFSGREVTRITYDADVFSVAFSPDGKYVVSSGCDKRDSKQNYSEHNCTQGSASVWETISSREVARMTHDDQVRSVAFSPDGKYVVSGSLDKTARVWDATTSKEVVRMTHDEYTVYAVAFSPAGKYVVSGSLDKTARVWDATTGKEVARMTHDNGVVAVAFSSDGKYVVSGGGDTARVWEAASGKEVARTTYEYDVYAVAFSPNGKYVVSGGCDKKKSDGGCAQGSARVWEAASGKEVARVTYDGAVSAIAFSPDGKYVVSGGDNTARVWEIASGKEVARMTHDGAVSAVAFSPDSKYVVSSSLDKTARVWDAVSGKEAARMTHDGAVYAVAFSPDGKYVVSGGDNTARVWEATTGKEVARMIHDGAVYAVAFSPNSKYVASGSFDTTARVWAWQPENLIANACAVMPRNLTRAEWQLYIGDALPYQPVCKNLPVEPEATSTPTVTAVLVPTLTPTTTPALNTP